MKKRFYVLLLSFIIIITSIPNTVYAQTTVSVNTIDAVNNENSESTVNEQVLESEISEEDLFPVSEEINIDEYTRQLEELVAEYNSDSESSEKLDNSGVTYAVAYDPRKVGKATSVKDQGQYGLCWDYSAIATAESAMIAANLASNNVDLSELHAAYFSYLKRGGTDFVSFCMNGGYSTDVYLLMRDGIGPVNESLAPMPSIITNATTVNDNYKYEHLADLYAIYAEDISVENQNTIKSYIQNYGGVQISYYSVGSSSYYKNNPDGSGDYSYYLPYQMNVTNHGVEVVGWNDNYSKYNFATTPSGNGAWLCKNSWGVNGWANNLPGTGYFWISYYDPTIQNVPGVALDFEPKTIHTSSITLNNTSLSMEKGATSQLVATVLPSNATNKNLYYTSNNETVATVDDNGFITAVGFGEATITVDSADWHSSASCKITVYGSELTLDKSELNIFTNQNNRENSGQIKVMFNSERLSNNEGLSYTIADDTIASIESSGATGCTIKGLKNGTTYLTVTYNHPINTNGKALSVSCLINVTTKVENIKTENECYSIYVGDNLSLKPVIYPENATIKNLKYSSDNTNVAIVDQYGKVLGISEGYAYIKIETEDGTVSKYISIQVLQQIESITTKQESYTLYTCTNGLVEDWFMNGVSLADEVSIYPETADKFNLQYKSLNENIITVDPMSGYITPISKGTAKVRIQSLDGKGAYKDVTIRVVEEAVYEISNSNNGQYSETLDNLPNNMLNLTFNLKYRGLYEGKLQEYITYTNSDPSVAEFVSSTVWPNYEESNNSFKQTSAEVTLKLLKPGKTTITMYVNDDLKKSYSIVLEVKESFAPGQVKVVDGNKYKILENNCVELIKYLKNEAEVVIPDYVTINGQQYAVTDINRNAFNSLRKKMTSVVIGDNVTSIPVSCFCNCDKLIKVHIGSKVTSISKEAFCSCDALSKIEIPSNVTYLGQGAFKGCLSLKTVTLSKNLKYLQTNAFNRCIKLSKIVIPSSVTSMGTSVFRDCTSLKTVTLSKNVKQIPSNTFNGCTKLSKINNLSTVRYIQENGFKKCSNLKTITFGKNLKLIGKSAFEGCTKLSKITITSKVNQIGSKVFYKCKNLKEITIKTTKLYKKNVDDNAFKGLNKNVVIKVPAKMLKSYTKLFKSKGLTGKNQKVQ